MSIGCRSCGEVPTQSVADPGSGATSATTAIDWPGRTSREPSGTSIAVAATRVYTWRFERTNGSALSVPLPQEPGRYVLSVIKMTDDGDVGAASIALTVQ